MPIPQGTSRVESPKNQARFTANRPPGCRGWKRSSGNSALSYGRRNRHSLSRARCRRTSA